MTFSSDVYAGFIIQGDLNGAIAYVKQFPDQADRYQRYMDWLEHEKYTAYDATDDVNRVLTIYQQYYRDVFYDCMDREKAAGHLHVRLCALLGVDEANTALDDLEQEHLPVLFERRGLSFMGGKTSGYYGPYVWRTTENVTYDVELPEGRQRYGVKLLDGFLTCSWMDALSFGMIGAGGWTDGDGIINCVKSAWNPDSEHFQVSLLKHEAQHARDLIRYEHMSSADLEYRAKLVELIYSRERNLLIPFAQEANSGDQSNGHAAAASKILKEFSRKLGVSRERIQQLSIGDIQSTARMLLEESNGAMASMSRA